MDNTHFNPNDLVPAMGGADTHTVPSGRTYRTVQESEGSKLMMDLRLESIVLKLPDGNKILSAAVTMRFIVKGKDKWPELRTRDLSGVGDADPGIIYKDKIAVPFCLMVPNSVYLVQQYKEKHVAEYVLNVLTQRFGLNEKNMVVAGMLDAAVENLVDTDPVIPQVLEG